MALEKPLDEIGEEDLFVLVDEQVTENRHIEYKRLLPLDTYDSKRELLADVSSLANAVGGHLLIGIQEEAGLAQAVIGVECDDPDAEILRLENLIRDGIKPRLQGVRAKAIRLKTGNYAFVLQIPRSWSKPHVVDFRGHWRFYSRTSAGKYPLDVSEVRSAFLQSGALVDKIRLFRDERLGSVVADSTPMDVLPGAKIVLHIVPYAAFETEGSFPLNTIADNPWPSLPLDLVVTGSRYNFDGFLIIGRSEGGLSYGYVQIFRNGALEAVDTSILNAKADGPIIPSIVFERNLIKCTTAHFDVLKAMGVPPPFSVMLSLLHMSGYIMAVNPHCDPWGLHKHRIDRDTLVLPEIICDDFPADVGRTLKPALDAVWNAAGWPASLTYSANGEWGKGLNAVR